MLSAALLRRALPLVSVVSVVSVGCTPPSPSIDRRRARPPASAFDATGDSGTRWTTPPFDIDDLPSPWWVAFAPWVPNRVVTSEGHLLTASGLRHATSAGFRFNEGFTDTDRHHWVGQHDGRVVGWNIERDHPEVFDLATGRQYPDLPAWVSIYDPWGMSGDALWLVDAGGHLKLFTYDEGWQCELVDTFDRAKDWRWINQLAYFGNRLVTIRGDDRLEAYQRRPEAGWTRLAVDLGRATALAAAGERFVVAGNIYEAGWTTSGTSRPPTAYHISDLTEPHPLSTEPMVAVSLVVDGHRAIVKEPDTGDALIFDLEHLDAAPIRVPAWVPGPQGYDGYDNPWSLRLRGEKLIARQWEGGPVVWFDLADAEQPPWPDGDELPVDQLIVEQPQDADFAFESDRVVDCLQHHATVTPR